MYKVFSTTPAEAVNGQVDLDFRTPDGWRPFAGDGTALTVLLGDESAGPMVFLSSFPPADEQMPLSFSHAHASDNWRISVRGTQNMGRDAYTAGQFRFQDGGVPYASDNVAWGPDGGFGIVMFADRRGFAIRPVNAKLAEKMAAGQVAAAKALGIDVQDPCPGAPAIATSFGPTQKGHLDGGFEGAAQWEALGPGARTGIALMGDHKCGPVLLFVRAEAGAVALPGRTLSTELLLAVVGGTAEVGPGTLDNGRVRIEEPGGANPAVVAGPGGLSLAVVVSDRRALTAAAAATAFTDPDWTGRLAARLEALGSQIGAH